MIEKKIHYCWFGGNPLPELVIKCIASWKEHCPDYEIIEWNESNFDLKICPYVQEAFACKKWAFISDYVRLFVLYHFGGIYMDTDVEVLASLDSFLENEGFLGFENETSVSTGIMGAEQGNTFIYSLLQDYSNRHFLLPNGQMDMTTNVKVMTQAVKTLGLIINNSKQTISGFTVYPSDYFSPKDSRSLKVHLTENSVAIHHFNGAWENQRGKKFKDFVKKVLGERLSLRISRWRNRSKE